MTVSADKHSADIIADLHRKGLTLSGISIKAGKDRSAASKALRKSWPAMERIIAAALDAEPADLWPSRYKDGPKPSTPAKSRHVYKRAAA